MPDSLNHPLEWLRSLPWFHIILVLLMIVTVVRLGAIARQLYELRESIEGLSRNWEHQLQEGGQAYKWLNTFSYSLMELRKVIGKEQERPNRS